MITDRPAANVTPILITCGAAIAVTVAAIVIGVLATMLHWQSTLPCLLNDTAVVAWGGAGVVGLRRALARRIDRAVEMITNEMEALMDEHAIRAEYSRSETRAAVDRLAADMTAAATASRVARYVDLADSTEPHLRSATQRP